jgi:hypothetical protein
MLGKVHHPFLVKIFNEMFIKENSFDKEGTMWKRWLGQEGIPMQKSETRTLHYTCTKATQNNL